MAMRPDIGSAEVSDDDPDADTVSITSTVLSEQKDEYPLEAILAEEKFKGVTKYLVKWEGYPEHRCTWETRSNFQDGEDSTFHEWETQKMRVSRGFAKPFDIPAFQERLEKWLAGVEERKLRRRLKRQRMGLPVSPIKSEGEDDTNDSQAEEEEEEDKPGIIRRRSGSKHKTPSISRSSDDSDDSEAMDTDSATETAETVHRQWNPKEEGALLRGLELCQGPEWTRILSMYSKTLEGFSVKDLEDQANEIKTSFCKSGKELPQYLRAIANKPTSTTLKEKPQERKSTSRTKFVDGKRDRGSETDDSLVEELRVKKEAKRKRKMQKPDGPRDVEGGVDKRNDPPKEGKHTESTKTSTVAARKPDNKPRIPQADMSPTETAPSSSAKNKAGAMDPDRREAAKPAFRPKMFQQKQANSRSGPVAATAPMTGPPRPGPRRPQPRPQAEMGAVGRGPSRASTNNVFIPAKKKRHAEGAAVLSNWNVSKAPHGNSSMAVKTTEASDKSEKWNKHSIIRRAVKKGRTEPAPNMDSLQLINPKDGRKVENTPLATTVVTTTKTAFEIIRDTAAQKQSESSDRLNGSPPNDVGWMDTVDAGLAADSNMDAESVAPALAVGSNQAGESPLEASDIDPKKKPTLSLQAYSRRFQTDPAPNVTPDPALAATIESPTDTTPTNAPSAPKAVTFKSFALPSTSIKPPQARPLPSRSSSPPDQILTPADASSSNRRPIPSGYAPQADHKPRDLVQPPISPVVQGAPFAPKAMKVAGLNPAIYTYEPKDVYGSIEIGPGRTSLGDVRFRGFESISARKQLIANSTGPKENFFWLSQICTAADYESRFHTGLSDELFSSGHIVPYSPNLAAINDLTEALRINVSGALYHSDRFTMLVYPPNSEDWAFLDQYLPSLPTVGLRCIIRTPMQRFDTESADGRIEKIRKRQERNGKQITFEAGEPVINAVMRNVYEIDYQRLIRHDKPEKISNGFKIFLIFPKERRTEQDMILQLIEANGAAEVYAYDENKNDGVWEYFSRSVVEGVIIAHSTFWRFHQLSGFARLLRLATMNVWSLSLRKSKEMSHPHLTRLFPHGCMMLITDSLLLLRPLEAVRILLWFRLRVIDTKPHGTWKIITRPNIRRFLTNCYRERKLDEEGKQLVQIYEQIAYMLDPDDLYNWEEDEPREEAPIHCMKKIKSFNTKVGRRVDYNKNLDLAAIQKNDNVLAEFFAGWANVHMEHYRRFHIISGFSDDGGKDQRNQWAEMWSYCEVFTPTQFYRRNGVPSQADLDAEAAKKHKQIMRNLQQKEDHLDNEITAEIGNEEAKLTQMEKHWKNQLDNNIKLKETYEGLIESQVIDELPALGEDATEESKYEDDDWSNDGSSVASVEMGQVVDGEGDEVMVGGQDSSELESWGLTDSDEESGSDSED